MENNERVFPRYAVFENELKLIKDINIRKWVIATLANVPNYFYIAQASSSGKYHPDCTNKVGGLVIHVKRAVYIANRLCSGWGIIDIEKDIVIAATILHDIAKVPSTKVMHSYRMKVTEEDFVNHPIYAAKYFASKKILISPDEKKFQDNTFAEERYLKIKSCIDNHMGLWSPEIIKKPLDTYRLIELLVYTADYIATTKDLITPEDE